MPQIQRLWFGIYGHGKKQPIKFGIEKLKFVAIIQYNLSVFILKKKLDLLEFLMRFTMLKPL